MYLLLRQYPNEVVLGLLYWPPLSIVRLIGARVSAIVFLLQY